MPNYNVQMTVTSVSTDVAAEVYFADGQTGTQTQSSFPGDALSFDIGPFTLTGSENFWVTLVTYDSAGNCADVKAIGPYYTADDAVEV